jgi:tRNA (cytidine/uridine-2'-O-)-methyltransferase
LRAIIIEEATIAVDLALYQPDIPQNTGAMLRLCACLGVRLHLIHPTGFPFSPAAVRRAGLDYVDHVELIEHDDFAGFEGWRAEEGRRLVLLTTRAPISVYDSVLEPDDVIMLGRESAGVPDDVADRAALRLRIPMRPGLRSLNVATAASLVLGEALRQTGALDHLE